MLSTFVLMILPPNSFQGSWPTTGMVINVSRGDSITTSIADPDGSQNPDGYGHDAFPLANRYVLVVYTQTCIFHFVFVIRQMYASCMRCCILVSCTAMI